MPQKVKFDHDDFLYLVIPIDSVSLEQSRNRLIANLLQDAKKKGIRRCNLPYFKGMSDAQLLREAVSRLGREVAYRCIGLKSHFLCVTSSNKTPLR